MARLSLLLLCCLAGVALCAAGEDPTEALPGVLDLTPADFDTHVNGAKHVLVEYYAPWCGHCKRMTGEYKKLAEAVTSDPQLKSRVLIAKVNADSHRSLGDKFGVKGFPTIKFFPRGSKEPVDYEGPRTTDGFLSYIKTKVEEDKGFGRVEELDPLALSFSSSEDRPGVITAVKAKIAELSEDVKANAEVYVKLMEKAQEKGVEWLEKEKARLNRMISTGAVAPSKLAEMSKKASVLEAFSQQKEA